MRLNHSHLKTLFSRSPEVFITSNHMRLTNTRSVLKPSFPWDTYTKTTMHKWNSKIYVCNSSTDLEATAELVEGVISRVEMVDVCRRLYGVWWSVSISVPLGWCGHRGGCLYWGHRLPHAHICPISERLDCITYRQRAKDGFYFSLKEELLGGPILLHR